MNYLQNMNFEERLNYILSSPNNKNTRNHALTAAALWQQVLANPGFRFNKSSPNFRRIQNKMTTILRTRVAPSPHKRN